MDYLTHSTTLWEILLLGIDLTSIGFKPRNPRAQCRLWAQDANNGFILHSWDTKTQTHPRFIMTLSVSLNCVYSPDSL